MAAWKSRYPTKLASVLIQQNQDRSKRTRLRIVAAKLTPKRNAPDSSGRSWRIGAAPDLVFKISLSSSPRPSRSLIVWALDAFVRQGAEQRRCRVNGPAGRGPARATRTTERGSSSEEPCASSPASYPARTIRQIAGASFMLCGWSEVQPFRLAACIRPLARIIKGSLKESSHYFRTKLLLSSHK